ncbi:MAG: ribosome biogenesis/translation initiation ATPase RLI [Promethearchaeota archaeon]
MKKVYLVDYSRCSVNSCGRPCIKKCPLYISEKRRKPNSPKIEIPIRFKQSSGKIIIISEICIKCGICANACQMKAIYVKNILEEDRDQTPVHVYKSIDGAEGFRLYGLPTLMPGRVTGLCGPNGIGKSTVLNILSGAVIPNFGREPTAGGASHELGAGNGKVNARWQVLLDHVKEHEMREHFSGLRDGSRTVAYKQQVLKVLFKEHEGKNVGEILTRSSTVDQEFFNFLKESLDLTAIWNRYLEQCSGGELQRFAIALILVRKADVYLIDEPCTFLDVKKRIQLANLLEYRAGGGGGGGSRSRNRPQLPVLVVEHDLAILDYLSDVVHLFYGTPHQFGVITAVMTNKAGINAYLNGYVKNENMQFRESKIGFKRSVGGRRWDNARIFAEYGRLTKTFDGFTLEMSPGVIYQSEILGIVGENGLGKSTFAKILAGKLKPDSDCGFEKLNAHVAYKPQYITKNYKGTVKEFIMETSSNYDFSEPMLKSLYRPLGIDRLFDKHIEELSGGELQRVFIVACLATRADLYVLDEPSAYLDVEERLFISSVIRSSTKKSHATTICIEHDIQIADALADRLLIFKGIPGVHGKTIGPLNKEAGMNEFLKLLGITFRRDESTGRARINKKNSQKDKMQRASGNYFYDK